MKNSNESINVTIYGEYETGKESFFLVFFMDTITSKEPKNLGVIITKNNNPEHVLDIINSLGLNPGGNDIAISVYSESEVDSKYVNRLLTIAEFEEFEKSLMIKEINEEYGDNLSMEDVHPFYELAGFVQKIANGEKLIFKDEKRINTLIKEALSITRKRAA